MRLLLAFILSLCIGIYYPQCTHTFTGYDSYGDGWNGASATITVNGAIAGQCNLLSGSSESVQFQASDGDLIKLDWVSGSWDSEISWDVTDGGNNTIAMGMWGTTTVGNGACPLATPCAALDYNQDFETGSTVMIGTSGAGSSIGLDAISANASLYGSHLQGNTSSYWYSPYSTGADAFASSPSHIATLTRDICAPTKPTVTLTFDKKQTYTYNVTYSWFRVTVNGIPIPDNNGEIYFDGSNGTWKTLTYDLSIYTGSAFTIGFESCNKYYTGYTSSGTGGDATYLDNIAITEVAGTPPPNVPGTISGNTYPNSGELITYSISPVNGANDYTWTVPNGWIIISPLTGTSIDVLTNDTDGSISVTANNLAGSSSARTQSVVTANLVTSYPYSTAFENESTDGTTASTLGFTFTENGWRNKTGDDGDWRTDIGGTGSSGTGPGSSTSGQSDHNPGTSSGKYIYMESSSPMFPTKEFHLWSPPYNLNGLTTPTLTFWYSLQSLSGASLSLQYSTNNGNSWSNDLAFMCPSISNAVVNCNMGSQWRQGFVDLTSYVNETNIMFRFLGTTGTSFDSDICLDDIKLVDASSSQIDVGEHLTLDGNNYSTATGLTLNGTSAQNINSGGYNLNNVTINNPNGVTVTSNDLKIDGLLTLTSGIITTGSNKVIITKDAANAIFGGNNTSYVNGNLRRHITTNVDSYAFPIGNGTSTSNYHRADLLNNNLNGVAYIDASVENMPTGNMNDLNTSQIGTMLTEVFDKQWKLTPNIQPTGGNYGVNIYLEGVSGAFLEDGNFTVVKRSDNSISWADWDTHESTTTIPASGQPGRTIVDGYGQKSGFTSFSLFGFGGSGGGALPIDLVSFNGEVLFELKPVVALDWTVASQVNNDYFTIERSTGGVEWSSIGKIYGVGNTSSEIKYNWIDNSPFGGVSYYRLKQTDYDGKSETFNPIAITISSKEKVLDKVINYMGQEVNEYYKGIVLEVYTDGTYIKKYYK